MQEDFVLMRDVQKTFSAINFDNFDNFEKSSSAPYLMWGSSSVDLSQAHSATTNLTTAPRGFLILPKIVTRIFRFSLPLSQW